MSQAIPEPVNRPTLAEWLWRRDVTLIQAGELFECSPEMVRLICLPFDDPKRRVPDSRTSAGGKPSLMERIITATGGDIIPAGFFAPMPARQPADAVEAPAQ